MDPDDAHGLVVPGSGARLRREGEAFVAETGDRFPIEDGIVRLLREVDPDLARELEAQDDALDEYLSPHFLMPRYERDVAELALMTLFGGQAPAGRILDAGCGIGLLGRLYPELHLVGLDASMTLLREARTGYRLRVEGSAEALPFESESFDVVVALNMLHHVIRPELAVSEFGRVLKPGGTLIAVDPRRVQMIELAKRVLRGKNPAFAPTHKAFAVSEYQSLVELDELFEIEDYRRVGLATLLAMGGLDALNLSRLLPRRDWFADTLRALDAALFRVPGVDRAGLNLAIRARRRA